MATTTPTNYVSATCTTSGGTGLAPGWYTGPTYSSTGWVQFNLGSPLQVTQASIWNWNWCNGWGVNNITFTTNTDGTTGTSRYGAKAVTLAAAPLTSPYPLNPANNFTISGNSAAQYFRMTITSGNTAAALTMVQLYVISGGTVTDYGVNSYVGTVRRVSNTSGTILALEWNSNIATEQPDTVGVYPGTYSNTALTNFNAGVACRHPSLVGGTVSSNQGQLNVGFVDGHVDTFTNVGINPTTPSNGAILIGDTMWNNYGAGRND